MAPISSSDSMLFENPGHQCDFLQNMEKLYKDQLLVDVTLRVRSHRIKCHRNVLACTSPYFHAMFTTRLAESNLDEIEMLEVEGETLKSAVEYSYTGVVRITLNNVQNLLSCASLLQIKPLLKACEQFMQGLLDSYNCIGIHNFASAHSCLDLKRKAKEHIEKNFIHVIQEDEFLDLNEDNLEGFLSSDDLNVKSEETVFEALIKWIAHDEETRAASIIRLLPHIRVALLTPDYLHKKVLLNRVVQQHKEKKLVGHVECGRTAVCRSNTPRFGMIKPEVCFLMIGGAGHNPLYPSANCYNVVSRNAFFMAEFQEEIGDVCCSVEDPCCVVTNDNQVYFAGGNYVLEHGHSDDVLFSDFYDDGIRRNFYLYDADNDEWVAKSPILFPKSNFALAAVDGKIYCFGGLTGNQQPTETVTSYNIAMDRWNYVGMMPTNLVDQVAVVKEDVIFVLGGRSGVVADNTARCYDPATNTWTSLACMRRPRFSFGGCFAGNELYIVGGLCYKERRNVIQRTPLNSVEIYNIDGNYWRRGPRLPQALYNTAVVLEGDELFVFGLTAQFSAGSSLHQSGVAYKLCLTDSCWTCIDSDLCISKKNYSCLAANLYTHKLPIGPGPVV